MEKTYKINCHYKNKNGTERVYVQHRKVTVKRLPVADELKNQILNDFQSGVPKKELSQKYGLSYYNLSKFTGVNHYQKSVEAN